MMMLIPEPIWQAEVQQLVFRELVECFSRPGKVRDLLDNDSTSNASLAVLATLVDGETTLADPHAQIVSSDWPLLQASKAAVDKASYIVVDGQQAPDFEPTLGTLESPEFGATILFNVAEVGDGPQTLHLSGPGIQQSRELQLSGLHPAWLQQREEWVAAFPLGVDIIFCAATRIVALPRTTRVTLPALTEAKI
jgi:alpha-D-ribose 1-methylphosphonate 5-triphosphate synthase subunit PhnH